MNACDNSGTSKSLLVRLQHAPFDQAAWAEFVDRYGQRIRSWCMQWGLQEADVQDISQTVLFKLLRALQSFQYDPKQKFRAWLKAVTHHAWQDLIRDRRQVGAGGENGVNDPLQSLAARDDLTAWVEGAYERELFDNAIRRVRPRVQPQNWDAFCLTTYQGLSGAEAAAQLGMAVTSVYKAKSIIRKLLEAEVHVLDGIGHE